MRLSRHDTAAMFRVGPTHCAGRQAVATGRARIQVARVFTAIELVFPCMCICVPRRVRLSSYSACTCRSKTNRKKQMKERQRGRDNKKRNFYRRIRFRVCSVIHGRRHAITHHIPCSSCNDIDSVAVGTLSQRIKLPIFNSDGKRRFRTSGSVSRRQTLLPSPATNRTRAEKLFFSDGASVDTRAVLSALFRAPPSFGCEDRFIVLSQLAVQIRSKELSSVEREQKIRKGICLGFLAN